MLSRLKSLLILTLLVSFCPSSALAQASLAEFQQVLQQKAAFATADFAALQQDQTIVRLAPVSDKREIAVTGLVNVRAGAEAFLHSYLDSMARKNNAAILEIGDFGNEPALADLQNLTIEPQDIEDLKQCVVGNCALKLSARMIERFRREINWQAPDYQLNASSLFKQMLVEYVNDYRDRGEAALIAYNDKTDEVSLAAEQRALTGQSSYVNDILSDKESGLRLIKDAIVWSKIKFGLKPVVAINHIMVYQRQHEVGPQVLVVSKQIYASHYFDAWVALTAFVSVPSSGNYVIYENRSRADGLEGPFSKIKRGIVEKKALEALRNILQHTRTTLDGPASTATSADYASYSSDGWRHRLFGGIRPLLWLLLLSSLIALLVLGKRRPDNDPKERRNKSLKPESAKS
jgi:hypothetical protein